VPRVLPPALFVASLLLTVALSKSAKII
jgi:hypothetical protein